MLLRSHVAGVLVAALLACSGARAAVISGASATASGPYDLSALGSGDWAYWSTTANPTSGSPTNEMSSSTLIGSLTAIGGGNLRGSGTPVGDISFAFNNGTAPVSGPVSGISGVFNSITNTSGTGVALAITLPTTDTYEVRIWGGGYNVDVGTFTASLPGATDFVDTSLSAGQSNPKQSILYTLTVTPDTANDVLSLSLVNTTDGAGNAGHVLLAGAAIQAVPEPATLPLLLVLTATGVTLVRKRRHPGREPISTSGRPTVSSVAAVSVRGAAD